MGYHKIQKNTQKQTGYVQKNEKWPALTEFSTKDFHLQCLISCSEVKTEMKQICSFYLEVHQYAFGGRL